MPRSLDQRSDTWAGRYSHWFLLVVALFITSLITANIIAVKLILVADQVVPAGVIIFPISYIFGDILTEVYGYHLTRRVIWLGFVCNLITVGAIWVAQVLPSPTFWEGQAAYDRILGYTPRLLAASFAAYLVGEFVNSFVLAKLKIATRGRWLWTRTIGSTVIGQAMDSGIFIALAFAGTIPSDALFIAIRTQWVIKVLYETAATPLTYAAVAFLKQREGIDAYDRHTRFNPFAVAER